MKKPCSWARTSSQSHKSVTEQGRDSQSSAPSPTREQPQVTSLFNCSLFLQDKALSCLFFFSYVFFHPEFKWMNSSLALSHLTSVTFTVVHCEPQAAATWGHVPRPTHMMTLLLLSAASSARGPALLLGFPTFPKSNAISSTGPLQRFCTPQSRAINPWIARLAQRPQICNYDTPHSQKA